MATNINDASNFGALIGAGRQVVRDSNGYLYAIVHDPTNYDIECWTPVSDTTYTYYFDASDNSTPGVPNDPDSKWTEDTDAVDGNLGTKATATALGTKTSNYLGIDGTTAPTSGAGIVQVRMRTHGGTSWGDYVTLTPPSGGWTWTKISNLESRSFVLVSTATTEIYADGDSGGTGLGSTTNLDGGTLSKIELEVTVQSTDGTDTWVELDSGDSPNAGSSSYKGLSCAIDSSGVIHVVYEYYESMIRGCRYVTFSSGNWGAPEEIGSSGNFVYGEYLALTVDSNNIPHVVGSDHWGDTALYNNRVGGAWNTSYTTITASAGPIDITIGSDDIPQIAVADMTNYDLELYKGNANDASSFTAYTVDSDIDNTTHQGVSIAIDSSGNTWVAYIDSGKTFYVTLAYHDNDKYAWDAGWTTSTSSNAGAEPSLFIDGSNVYVLYQNDSEDIAYEKYNANTYYFDASVSGPTDPDTAWTDDGNAFDGEVSNFAYTETYGTVDTYELSAVGTTAPSDGGTISLVRARVYAGNSGSNDGWGGWVNLSTPSGGWTWTKLENLETKLYVTAPFDDQMNAIIYSSAESLGTATRDIGIATQWDAYRVEIQVITTSGETLLEEGTYQDVKTRWALATQYSSSGSLISSLKRYYFDASDNGGNAEDLSSVWTDDNSSCDGNYGTYASTSTVGSESSNYLKIQGTNAPASGKTIVGVYAVINYWTYTPTTGSWEIKLNTPDGGWSWSIIQALEVRAYYDGANAVAGIYLDGGSTLLGTVHSGTDTGGYLYIVEIYVQTSDTASNIDYLFSDGTDVYWNQKSFITTNTSSHSNKANTKTTYYCGCTWDWNPSYLNGQNKGFNS